MNTKLILSSRPESLPHFPALEVKKHRRVMTKHFTNTALWLSSDEWMLLNWLVYQTAADNTFKYSTKLLKQFIAAKKEARKEYSLGALCSEYNSISYARRQMVNLIESGLVFPTSRKGYLMINPMLTYSADVVNNKKYKEVQELYQQSSPETAVDISEHFIKLVSQFLESKKPNYKYGKRR